MNKRTNITIIALAVGLIGTAIAQVGVNTSNPQSVFEIAASNPAAPAATDGILIPTINAFPTTNPAANQDGMLVYLDANLTGYKKGHYYWDNSSSSWEYFAGEWVDGYNNSNTDLTYVKQAMKENDQDVVILDIGKMGMGTDNPDETLEIKLPGDNDIQISSDGTIPNAPNLIYYTRGGSFATPDFHNNNEPIGELSATGWNGSGESDILAAITSRADGDHSSGDLPTRFNFSVTANGNDSEDDDGIEMTIRATGNVGMGVDNPTAYLHLKAGTASANSAPIKFNSGTLTTTPETGTLEYDGTHLYFTPNTTREVLLKYQTGSAVLDYLPLVSGVHSEQTVTVTGAAVGSSCECSPVGGIEAGLTWSCYVSAANTVTIRLGNITGSNINPVSRTWVATVIE